MKNIYLTLLTFLTVIVVNASPDIYTPTLVAPGNNATKVFPNVELDWNPVTGGIGLHYELQLDTTSTFNNPVLFTTSLTSQKMSMLLFNQTYYWRVRAVDNTSSSEWTDSRSFTTIVVPELKRPNDSSRFAAPNVEIQWNDLPGATYLDFQFDTSANFDSPRMKIMSIINNGTKTNAANLHFGEWYKVRMRARHNNDTTIWSALRSFLVTDTVILKKPTNNSVGAVPNTTFEWTTIGGLTKWQVHLSTDPSMENYDAYNASKTARTLTPDTLMFNKKYYWRMAAIHEADTLLSHIFAFTTIDKPTLTFPANNATNIELQPTLTWEAMSGLVAFQLDIANNEQFHNVFSYYIDEGGVNQFKVPIHVLDSASVYYWRVRAISSRDTSLYSDTWNFRSITLGTEEAISIKSGVRIYPSPASTKATVQLKNTLNGKANIEIYDLLGTRRMVTSVSFVNGTYKDLNVAELNEGIYIISVLINSQRYTGKLIIQD